MGWDELAPFKEERRGISRVRESQGLQGEGARGVAVFFEVAPWRRACVCYDVAPLGDGPAARVSRLNRGNWGKGKNEHGVKSICNPFDGLMRNGAKTFGVEALTISICRERRAHFDRSHAVPFMHTHQGLLCGMRGVRGFSN